MTALRLIQLEFEKHLRDMAGMLPADYQLTLVARHSTRRDSDIVMTSDDLPKVVEAIRFFKP